MKFTNKTIWITGASSGIGEAIAMELSKVNCKLILSSRNKETLESIKGKCHSTASVEIVVLDLEQTESIKQIVENTINQFGPIDYLFNNGGVSQRSYANETDIEVDRRIMEINFFGNIALTKAVLPGMIQQKSGHIIITSSVAGKYGYFQRTAYAASKHALHGFYESLRLEQKENNIKFTIVCPGPVNTSMAKNALTQDGTPTGKSDRLLNAGWSAAKAARKILSVTEKEKEEVYFGGKEIIPIYIKRFFPSLFTSIMYKDKPK